MRINFDRARVFWYVWSRKISQLPKVFKENTPQIFSDEIFRPAQGDTYAIIVKYVKFGLSTDFLALLDSLAAASVNAIVVCNGKPTPQMRAQIAARAHRILVRPNIGRDFGAYRAATLHILAGGLKPSRVIYLNDSVYFLAGPALDHLTRQLASPTYDVVGALENHAFSHHLGSYALSLSGAAFADRKIVRFWRRYRPYDLRLHAINKGEMRLSSTLKRCGYRFDTVYGAEKLADRLTAMSLAQIVNHMRYLPRDFQLKNLSSTLHSVALLDSMFSEEPGMQVYGAPKPHAQTYVPLPRLRLDQDDQTEAALVKATLIDTIMHVVSNSSQIHFGFGLFHKLLGCPIVKKDLLQRDVFTEHQMISILDDVPEEERATILRELINRGRPTHPTKKTYFLMRYGLI